MFAIISNSLHIISYNVQLYLIYDDIEPRLCKHVCLVIVIILEYIVRIINIGLIDYDIRLWEMVWYGYGMVWKEEVGIGSVYLALKCDNMAMPDFIWCCQLSPSLHCFYRCCYLTFIHIIPTYYYTLYKSYVNTLFHNTLYNVHIITIITF